VRVVAQERGVPCQVAVTTAFRTGSLVDASTTAPEITPWPDGCAKVGAHTTYKSRESLARAIVFIRRQLRAGKFQQSETELGIFGVCPHADAWRFRCAWQCAEGFA
jgi:hypothetical protein